MAASRRSRAQREDAASTVAEQPRGTVTFLFTDIERSTELVTRLGDRYGDVLGDHRRLLRGAFAEFNGWEVDTQGDAFFVAFDRVKDAVLAAAAIQHALAKHIWPAAPAPKVRIGLHTTEPYISVEGYHGVGVHRASRICAIGHGGQVLLSRSTAGLAADEEFEGIGLADLGEHRLKGIDQAERIFQLTIDGLQKDFPPLDTIEGAGLATETVTVLIADLEGLTRRVGKLSPEQFRGLVAECHRTVGRVLSETGGRGMIAGGDMASAVYRSARQAALAAAKLQRKVSELTWPGERVRVAVALDSGEVVATAYGHFGPAVTRCVRLLEYAVGAEIVLSEATRQLLAGENLGDLELRSRGEKQVTYESGMLRPGGAWSTTMQIYDLIVPGLPPGYLTPRVRLRQPTPRS
jgi:class 3 adenylate cyclase